MGIYKFEMTASVSDIFDVEADSYEDAVKEAEATGADGYYPIAPEGYSFPWDHVEVICIEEPDEEEEE